MAQSACYVGGMLEEFVLVEWTEGIIVPLYKEGNERDVGNYRGIALGSHITKVFLFNDERKALWCS